MESGTTQIAECVTVERKAFFDVKPTAEEQEQLDARPADQENAAMQALVTAVATDAVLEAFDELLYSDRDLSSKLTALAAAVTKGPESLTVDESTLPDDARQASDDAAKLQEATIAAGRGIDDVFNVDQEFAKIRESTTAARQDIEYIAKLHFANMDLLEAGKNFDSAVKKIVTWQELNLMPRSQLSSLGNNLAAPWGALDRMYADRPCRSELAALTQNRQGGCG